MKQMINKVLIICILFFVVALIYPVFAVFATEVPSNEKKQAQEVESSTNDTKTSSDKEILVTDLELSSETLVIKDRKQVSLFVTTKPSNATNTAIRWRSSDESVATVNEKRSSNTSFIWYNTNYCNYNRWY